MGRKHADGREAEETLREVVTHAQGWKFESRDPWERDGEQQAVDMTTCRLHDV